MKLLFLSSVLFLARTARCVSVLPNETLYLGSGSTASLSCSFVTEQGNVTWLKGDVGSEIEVNIQNQSRISTNNNSLTITNYQNSQDGGSYSCLVEDGQGHRQLSCPTQLKHARIMANTFSQVVNKTLQVKENSTAVFVCSVPLSWPPAQIHWERGGERVDHQADSRLWLLPSGNLYIIGVRMEDEGVYSCSALNSVTGATRHSREIWQLTVTTVSPANSTSPSFTVRPVDTVTVAGTKEVVLECSGHAHPEPSLEWIIIHDVHFPKEGRVLPTGALQFTDVTAEDAGVYRCHLENSVGTEYVDIHLQVQEPPSLTSIPDSLIALPTQTEDRIILSCSATGTVPLKLVFLFDGVMLSSQMVNDSLGTVSITHTVMKEGFYQCFATNEAGCQQWTTFATTPLATDTPSTETETERSTTAVLFPDATTTTTSGESTSEETETESALTGSLETPPFTEHATTTSHETVSTTSLVTTDTPTLSHSTTPPAPPPALDVMTNGDYFEVRLGSELTIECHVRGGGEGTHVSWYFNKQPLTNVSVELREEGEGGQLLVSSLTFDSVKLSHSGEYQCQANSPVNSQTVTAPITLTVSTIVGPPLNVTVSASSGGLLLSWMPNPNNEGHAVGYKLAWDESLSVSQSAIVSVAPSITQYLIQSIDLSKQWTILVWAYTMEGDGLLATANWVPKTAVPITTPTTPPTTPPVVCTATEISPSCVLLENSVEVGAVNVTASCLDSHTSTVSMVTKGSSSFRVNDLLPGCRYQFKVGGATCSADTPPGHVDLNEKVHRYDNGSIRLDWHLPRELSNHGDLVIEVNVNEEWIPVRYHGNIPHIQTHLDEAVERRIQLRLRLREWVGFAEILIPAVPVATTTLPPAVTSDPVSGAGEEVSGGGAEEEVFYLNEVGLIYGVVFALLVVACAVVLVVILILKYIQMNRRDSDKETNHREIQREEFRRLSLQRSSVNSIKKEPQDLYQPKQTDV